MEAKSSELIDSDFLPTRALRVLIDGRKLLHGGIGVYTQNLITGLLEVGGVDVTVLYADELAKSFPFTPHVTWVKESARPYSVDELLWMPRRINFARFDVFHTPHYMLPYGIPIPTVVTVHDLIHVTHPEKFYYPFVAKKLIRSAVRRADGVLAVSRDARNRVVALTGAASDKVRHVPNAISFKVTGGAGARAAAHGASPLPEPYFLTLVSNNKPHKGVRDLLAAYQAYRDGRRWESVTSRCPSLVLAGFGAEEIAVHGASGMPMEGVTVVGKLGDDQLAAYLANALALIVPSLVEGFCLPALEAQAVGTPVICRPVPALLEIVSERDTVAQDFSVAGLVDAIADGARRGVEPRCDVPQAHLDFFSCKNTAAVVKSVYEGVLASRRMS